MQCEKIAISVIMSVYNTDKIFLQEAIDSILKQTFTDFEFIIIDDCSNEQTTEILRQYSDDRIILVRNSTNLGLALSLNKGIDIARGEYIARMDSDDVSFPNRLKDQYMFMESNPSIDIVGGWVKINHKTIKYGGKISTKWRKVRMLFDNVGICHPSAFIRKDFLNRNQLRYNNYRYSQDYDLWCRCLEYGEISIVPKVVLNYRIHDGQVSIAKKVEQDQIKSLIKKKQLDRLISNYSERECCQIAHMDQEILSAKELAALFDRLKSADRENAYYDAVYLDNELLFIWLKILMGAYARKDRKPYLCHRMSLKLLKPTFWLHLLKTEISKNI